MQRAFDIVPALAVSCTVLHAGVHALLRKSLRHPLRRLTGLITDRNPTVS
jgi:hypothetical protein